MFNKISVYKLIKWKPNQLMEIRFYIKQLYFIFNDVFVASYYVLWFDALKTMDCLSTVWHTIAFPTWVIHKKWCREIAQNSIRKIFLNWWFQNRKKYDKLQLLLQAQSPKQHIDKVSQLPALRLNTTKRCTFQLLNCWNRKLW